MAGKLSEGLCYNCVHVSKKLWLLLLLLLLAITKTDSETLCPM
jgi:hypothetical protein